MRLLKAFARQLGPLGLMPSIKGGTLVKEEELEDAISLVKKGQIEFK
jgi:ribosomal protein L1